MAENLAEIAPRYEMVGRQLNATQIKASTPTLEALVSQMTSAEAAKLQVSSETRTSLLLLKATVAKQRKHTLFVASSELKQTSSTEYELVARYTILLPMQLDQPEFSLINLQIFRVLVKRTVGSDGLTQRSS